LKGVREHYPDAPIYLMCDGGGNDYSKAAKYFNCTYVQFSNNVDLHFQKGSENDENNNPVPKELNVQLYLAYLRRMKDAISFLDTDYVLRLEDDVRCTGKVWHIPKFDVIGPFNIYGTFDDVTNHYINYARGTSYSKENDKIYNHNCGGGAIFKRTSFLEYINHVLDNPDVAYYLYDLHKRNLNDKAIADGLGMLFFGYTMGRSFNIADVTVDIGQLKKYVTIIHHYKEDYGKKCNLKELMSACLDLTSTTSTTLTTSTSTSRCIHRSNSSVKDMVKKYEKDITQSVTHE
jgi:hypothetical protein